MTSVLSSNVSHVRLCGSSGWDTAVVSGIVGDGCAQLCLKASDCKSRGKYLISEREVLQQQVLQ